MQRLVAACLALGLAAALSGGCSRQGEGERCDLAAAGDDDCEDGLICVSKVGNVDRCCPPEGAPIDDSRCSAADAPSGGPTGGRASSSGGASSGGASSGGTSAGGTSSGGTETGGTETGGTSGGTTSSGGAVDMPVAGAGDSAGSGGQSEGTAGSSGASADAGQSG